MSEVTQVEVSIMGRTFTIGTPAAEKETLLDAVRMLNEKADAIRNMGKIVDADKIAIMAALNIAHDLLKIKIGGGLEMSEIQRKLRSMGDMAEQALKDSQPPQS